MNIRKSHRDDVESIVKSYFDMVHTVNAPFYDQKQLQMWIPEDAAQFTEKWEPVVESEHAFSVEIDNELVGFGAFDPGQGSLRVFAFTDYLHLGIQEELVELLAPLARGAGLTELRMLVTKGELSFFEDLDFDVIETHNDLFTHVVIKHL